MVPFGYGILFAFHSNYGRKFRRFDTIHERDSQPDAHGATHQRHHWTPFAGV